MLTYPSWNVMLCEKSADMVRTLCSTGDLPELECNVVSDISRHGVKLMSGGLTM